MKHTELDLEKRCRDYARKQGWVCWKNEKNGCKGIPDDSFLSPDGSRFFMVEFKSSPTAKIRPEQIVWQNRYPNVVFFVRDYDFFLKILSN